MAVVVVRCFCWRFIRIIILSVVSLNSSFTLLLLECFLVDAVEARYHGFQRCFFVSCVMPQRGKKRQHPGDFWPRSLFFFVMNDRPSTLENASSVL